jgi:hypothetical protein
MSMFKFNPFMMPRKFAPGVLALFRPAAGLPLAPSDQNQQAGR